MTDKKMTKEEAQEAADTFCQSLTCGCTNEQVGDCYVVSTAGIELTRFRYAEPVPVPEKKQTVVSRKTGRVVYSLGKLDSDNELRCSVASNGDYPITIKSWEPVEIVRNGEHAKALELLARCDSLIGDGWVGIKKDISAFLADAEKVGDV